MFTVVPVPARWRSADGAARSLGWLPLVGAALGALAGLPAAGLVARSHASLPAAVLAVAVLALLTRGLHLDGLADTADGLGSNAPPARALEIMRRSDIGPFGVITLVLVLVADIAAVAELAARGTWHPLAALVVAAGTGRLAVCHACLPGLPPARPDGFGALVAGRMSPLGAMVLTAATLGSGAGLAVAVGASAWQWPLAQGAGLALAVLLRAHTTRRLGGTTGDVFGALVEIATAATLLGLVLAR
jgi:adenosylcobinamide-GDP ribazoletransferase